MQFQGKGSPLTFTSEKFRACGKNEKRKLKSCTYSYGVHELITEVERSHRGLEMQYPRLKNVYRSLQVV